MRLEKIIPILLGLLILGALPKIYCQVTDNTGFKYFNNYYIKDYGLSAQNWCILQDKRGIIYVANQGGLCEFDGVDWRAIEVPHKTVHSIAINENDTIYIGGKNEIGFLAPDVYGTLKYVSLVDQIKDSPKEFLTVWKTHATKDGVYFRTKNYLFRWKSGRMTRWGVNSGHSFKNSFYCDDTFIVHDINRGLMQIAGDSPQLLPGTEILASVRVYTVFRYNSRKLLIGTRSNGFYIYDGKTTVPFHMDASDYLGKKELFEGLRLTTGDFALATRLGGLVIINPEGKTKDIFNKASGLQDENVRYVFEDFQGNLWLGLDKGIAKIEYNSPISIFDERSGLPGLVLSVRRHRETLYAVTSIGLYYYDTSSLKFTRIPKLTGLCFSILSTADSLLAATNKGVFQVDDKNKTYWKITGTPSYCLHRSKKNSNRAWVGTHTGLASLYLENGRWKKEHQFKNISSEIRYIVEDEKGNLWLGPSIDSVIKIDFPMNGPLTNPEITEYDASHGLPPKQGVRIFTAAGHIMFATEKGLFQFDTKNKKFIPDSTLTDEFAGHSKGKGVFRITEENEKTIWFHSNHRNKKALPGPGGSFIIDEKPFLRVPSAQVEEIYPDPGGDIIWLAGHDGLIRYDKRFDKNYNLKFTSIVRQVLVNGKLFFNGYELQSNTHSNSEAPLPVFKYKDRNIRIQFAAPFFEGETKTQYQWVLEGYDDQWSGLSPETKKDYTNLDSGNYTFRVRAKNVYGTLSNEAVFQFKVLPPWYQTWWAYLLYAAAAFFTLILLFKWRSRKLVLEKERLERIVLQRTREVKDKNKRLEEQSEKLKEMDQIKSRFFANISHEFRTPITLLMGPLEQLIADCRDNETERKRKLTLMQRNAQRLLRLINQLLELSKLDSGKMKLQAAKKDVVSFVKGITDSFRFLVQQKEMDLVFRVDRENETKEKEILLYIDLRKMEDIMSNLLINAVKFTPAGGEIRAAVKEFEECVEISVSDTGPGIPADQLAHVFDRFFQADATYEHYQKGSGIGLALSKELVELHHGIITARSKEGEGTTFTIRLPMGKEHLAAEEIVEPCNRVDTNGDETQSNTNAEIVRLEQELSKEVQETESAAGLDLDREMPVNEPDIILVVEDSADMREYIKEALEPNYTVVEAEDGKEGVQKAQEIIPDLIISDIMMPEIDGYELCRVLKSDVQTSHIPVILLTAKASEESIVEGLETGADDYITKPFNTMILSARIKNLIDIRSQLQQNVNREMNLQPVKTSVSKIDREFLKDLQTVLRKNIADPEFNVEEMCKKLYMSSTTLYRKIRALCGQTPTEFIRSFRLNRAAQLLKSGSGSVTEVAFEVGFSSRTYFTKCFKEKFQQLPSEYSDAGHQ
jgi:signal transduction histidine kinase/DNA-binding NarL/FixJ family response regulator/ligand-binding sensor domain-containing protein